MKVKRSFPLTSVETVEYDESNDPTRFQLVFSNCIEVVQAETAEEASDWVEKIVEGECYQIPHLLHTFQDCYIFYPHSMC